MSPETKNQDRFYTYGGWVPMTEVFPDSSVDRNRPTDPWEIRAQREPDPRNDWALENAGFVNGMKDLMETIVEIPEDIRTAIE